MGRATHMLILVLVLGAVVAGAVPPAPATAGPPGCPVFPFPDDAFGSGMTNLVPRIGHLPAPEPPPNWADQVAGVIYRGVLRPVMKLLLLL